jgi:uncharacterized membrane protein
MFSLQVVSVMSMWTGLQPAYSANMWNEALNKQLGTEVSVGFSLFLFCVCIKFVNKRMKSLRQREERIRK